jgi:hypothetical protein
MLFFGSYSRSTPAWSTAQKELIHSQVSVVPAVQEEDRYEEPDLITGSKQSGGIPGNRLVAEKACK